MATPDSLFYEFTAVQIGATGTLTLVVYFEGDFGANSEYISFYDEGGYLIGVTQPYFNATIVWWILPYSLFLPAILLVGALMIQLKLWSYI